MCTCYLPQTIIHYFSPKQYPNSTSFANWISNANVEIRIQNVIMISTCASANLDTSPNPIQRDSIGALVSSISYHQKYIRIHLCIFIKRLYLHIENFPPRLPYYHQHQKIINYFFLIQNPINLKKFWIPPLVPMWITPPLVSWLVWHLCLLSSVLYFSCLPSKQENQSRNRIWINSREKIYYTLLQIQSKNVTPKYVLALLVQTDSPHFGTLLEQGRNGHQLHIYRCANNDVNIPQLLSFRSHTSGSRLTWGENENIRQLGHQIKI